MILQKHKTDVMLNVVFINVPIYQVHNYIVLYSDNEKL